MIDKINNPGVVWLEAFSIILLNFKSSAIFVKVQLAMADIFLYIA